MSVTSILFHFLYKLMIENIQEQFGETSANGFHNSPAIVNKPQIQRISKKGGPRFSFQQRTSQKNQKQRNSKLKVSTPSAFEKANWELAVQNTKKKMNRYHKGKEVSCDVELEHFKIYGPGIYLFFSFLKNVTVIFFLMSIVQLIPVIYNYNQGNGLSTLTVSINYYFARTTIAAISSSTSTTPSQDKLINVVSDMFCIFIFIVFYFFWLKRGNQLTEEVRKEVKLKSYTVVEIINPPTKATQQDIRNFMTQFGKVVEVAPVKDYDESINLSKTIYDLEVEVKQLQLKLEEQADQELQQKIKQKKLDIDEVYKELVLYQDDIKEETLKYYVTFSTMQEREKALKTLQPYKGTNCDCFSDPPPQNLLLCGQKVGIEACHTEPGEIIWQNQHVTWKTRWIRALIQFISLLAVIVIGFLVISFLNILAPPSATSVDTSSYTATTIIAVTNTTIAQSWCISNQASVLTASGSEIYTFCWGYIQKYFIKIAITIGIAFAVIIIKAIIKLVVVYLAKFQRYKSHTEQSKDITQNLLITYVCTTVLITFLLLAQFGKLSFKNLISNFISSDYLNENLNQLSTYSDFISDWYPNIGYQIFITWVIMIIHPSLTMPLAHFFGELYGECKAKGQQVQAKMEKKMEPIQFQIQDNYANIMMIIFVSLGLSPGMPLITIVSFFALWFRYLYLKYIFIRFCKVPKVYDEALDIKVSGLIPYGVCIHFMIGIWMFGVTSIFSSNTSTFDSWVSGLDFAFIKQIAFILARMLGTWYYSAFFFLVLAMFFFKLIIFNLIAKNFMEDTKDIDVIKIRACSDGTEDILNMSTKSICDSYKIQNNPDYAQVLSIMHKKRKFVVRVKDMQST